MISAICVSCRDEVAKAIRRALGDNGGVKCGSIGLGRGITLGQLSVKKKGGAKWTV